MSNYLALSFFAVPATLGGAPLLWRLVRRWRQREKDLQNLSTELLRRAHLAQATAGHYPVDFRRVGLDQLGGMTDDRGNIYALVSPGEGEITLRGQCGAVLSLFGRPLIFEVRVTLTTISSVKRVHRSLK